MLRVVRNTRHLVTLTAMMLLCLPRLAFAQEQRPTLRRYISYRTPNALRIDGRLDEPYWHAADWSEPFVDIEGESRPPPSLRTRFKLLWDDDYLYVAAELEEPETWATLTERDAVIYRDNDFEVFIDPDGDTHNYVEVEINALGTVWDLILLKPYRDGGPAVSAWDIDGLLASVSVDGTLNHPSDTDRGWTIELAIPWSELIEFAPERSAPGDADLWRLNFSRVQWRLEVVDGHYRKETDPATGKPYPEHNWVWSPQGAINMHMPERWGVVQFSETTVGDGPVPAAPLIDEDIRWALRYLYYAQREFRRTSGGYATDLAALNYRVILDDGTELRPALVITDEGYQATAPGSGGTVWNIRHDGRIWKDQSGG
jgi:hypothetical protein